MHTPGKVVDPDYISRFGFIPGETHEYYNPDGLPIGFAIDNHFVDPRLPEKDQKEVKVIGLTCAGCHTGMVTHKGDDGKLVGIRIEGGSAMINVRVFQEAIGRALFYTRILPLRFDAFADGRARPPEAARRRREPRETPRAARRHDRRRHEERPRPPSGWACSSWSTGSPGPTPWR